MTGDGEQRIRDRAYHLWEAAGRPHGRDGEFWDRAVHEEHAAAAKPAVVTPVAVARAGKPNKPAAKKAAGRSKTAAAPPPALSKAKPGAATRG